jgi:hypothetical protein
MMSPHKSSPAVPPPAFYNGKDSTVDPVIHGRGVPPERFVRRALDIFNEHDLDPPDVDRLHILVAAAMEAMSLFFAASLVDPDTIALHTFFGDFVTRCAMTGDLP